MDRKQRPFLPGGRIAAVLLMAALAVFALAMAACGDDDKSSTTPVPASTTAATSASQTTTGKGATASGSNTGSASTNAITIEGFEMGYKVSGKLRPGTATITFKNTGGTTHMMAATRLKDGVTLDQVKAALKRSEDAAAPLMADGPDASTYGTPALVSAGESSTVTAVNLKPGNYAILCFVPGPDGMPHAAMGMISMFTVEGDPVTTAPKSDGDIDISDTAIKLPDGFTGKGTYKVTDSGQKPHTISFAKLDAGKSLQDYFAYVGGKFAANQPPDGGGGTLVGGIDSLLPGQTAYVTLDLKPGHYGYVSTEEDDQLGGEFDVK
jgi:plastocyanin